MDIRHHRFASTIVIVLALAVLCIPQAAHAATGPLCYVDADATGDHNGDSWADAYPDLQSALFLPSCTEVWVAEGLYKPGWQQMHTFQVLPGAKVYGGFVGTETARTQRNWNTNITVLSGDIDDNDTIDANGVVQDYTDITGSNSHHIVTMDGTGTQVTSSTVLDGFVVTAGSADGPGMSDVGGGLLCNGSSGGVCSPTLSNLTFVGNQAASGGGAIYDYGVNGTSSPTISSSTFTHNHAFDCGALYNHGAGGVSSPVLTSVTFSYNSAEEAGGAMCNDGYSGASNPAVTDATFDHNSVPGGSGGAVYNYASGASSNAKPTFQSVTFSSNSAEQGGAIYNYDEAGGSGDGYLIDVSLVGNSAEDGGAIYNNGAGGYADPKLRGVTFEGNSASNNGGAIYDYATSSGHAHPEVSNVTFYGNSASNDGGAMFNLSESGDTQTYLRNVTFSGNSAGGSGGATYTARMTGSAGFVMMNVILWGDSATGSGNEVYVLGSGTNIVTSVVQGGCPSNCTCTDLITTDPKLGPLEDNGGGTETMSLIWGSSAINNGDEVTCNSPSPVNGKDERGITRPQGAECDIGALERVPFGKRADFESDGVSDMAYFHAATGLWAVLESSEDFGYSAAHYYTWGQTSDIVAAGDYDGDGRLDPTIRRPPAGGQSMAYMMLLSTTGYDYASALTVPAGWTGLNDIAVPGDYNGDGYSDPAIWRGNTGVWIIPLSPSFNTYSFYAWGANGDTPIGADVDGDGQTDIGYWRPSTGVWGFLQSSQGYSYASPLFFSWGSSTDTAVMADYDGDGKADPAVVIPASGGQSKAYRILLSTLAYDPAQSMTVPAGWLGLNDRPVPADYDGDGKADAGIWRSNTGVWIIPKSSTSNTSYMFAAWGAFGDEVAR